MKKALVISGQSRFVKEGHVAFKKNLHNFEEYDVFVHNWIGEHNVDVTVYNPKSVLFEYQKPVLPPEIKECSEDVFRTCSMFFSMKEALALKRKHEQDNNFRYDLVVWTRFDVALESPLNPEVYDLKNNVYSPNVCANPSVISDWLNFSSSENMDVYGEIHSNIVNLYKKGSAPNSGEDLITHMLREHNIPIRKIPCELWLLRDRSKHQVLSTYWKYAN